MQVTGDKAHGTMFSPSRFPLRASFHRKRGFWVRGSVRTMKNLSFHSQSGQIQSGPKQLIKSHETL